MASTLEYGVPLIASSILSHSVDPISGNHILDFGLFIFLLQLFLKRAPRIAIRICKRDPQSNDVKSNSIIIWTVSPSFFAAPAIPLAILTALITSPATSLTRFIEDVIPSRIRLLNPLTAESIAIPIALVAILFTARAAIWFAKLTVSDNALCTSPNHIGFLAQNRSKICDKNDINILMTTIGIN